MIWLKHLRMVCVDVTKGSVFPNGTLHDLAATEDVVGLPVVQQGARKHKEVKDLMARSAHVKLSRCPALRAFEHVDYCALNVDIASKGVDPASVCSDVRFHGHEDKKDGASAQPEYDVHDSAHFLVTRLVKLRNESYNEASEANSCQTPDKDMFSNYSKTENKSYAQNSWSDSVAHSCECCSYHLSEGMPLHSSTQGMKRQRSRSKCLHSRFYWWRSDTSRSWRRMHGIVLKHPCRSKLRRCWWTVAKSELRLRFGQL